MSILKKYFDLGRHSGDQADAISFATSATCTTGVAEPLTRDKLEAAIKMFEQKQHELYTEQMRRMYKQMIDPYAYYQDKLAQQPPPKPKTTPYVDPKPLADSAPKCPICSKVMLRSDATWGREEPYWICSLHGAWRKLNGHIIPPHPNDSANCGHWIKDRMTWNWQTQRWECEECTKEKHEDKQ